MSTELLSCKSVISFPVGLLEIPTNVIISDEFKENILSKFRTDEIGNYCRRDETILLIGSIFYGKMMRKSDKSVDIKKSVRTDMRRLASLYLHFKEHSCMEPVFGNSHDMFNRANFTTLSDAIEAFTTAPEKKLKPGLKQNLYYLLLRSAKQTTIFSGRFQ